MSADFASGLRSSLCAVAVLLLVCMSVLAGQVAEAHANGSSYLRIDSRGRDAGVVARWDIAAADLQLPLEIDANGDGIVTAVEIGARRTAITKFATGRLRLRRGGDPCRMTMRGLSTLRRDAQLYLTLQLSGACLRGGPVDVTTDLFFGSRGYSTLLDVQTPNGRFPAVLSMGNANWTEPTVPSITGTVLRFFREGAWHVLIGYDHIAFLLLLLLPSVLRGSRAGWTAAANGREIVRDIFKIVTAFTIAHSVALGLAATDTVRVPVQPIEIAIAGSIVVAGLLNLFPAASRWRLRLAFGFGFVHGFGFANALQNIGAGGSRLAPLLAGFNLGVEVAQIMIVAVALPVLWLLSRRSEYASRLMPALSLATAFTGAIWFTSRL